MRNTLIAHSHRYPQWALTDLYKLIHQATMGSEHALTDEAHVRHYLLQELAELSQGPDEPLVDPISSDGQVVRIHLRPFVRLHLNPETLLQAFLLTGKKFPKSTELLLEYADVAIRLAQEGQIPFNANELHDFVTNMQASAFPAVHHSHTFEAAYLPAYRVVAREWLPREIPSLKVKNLVSLR